MLKDYSTEQLVEELVSRGLSEEELQGALFAVESQATGKDWQHNGTGEEGQHGKPKTEEVPF
jgi:hypothetical protein